MGYKLCSLINGCQKSNECPGCSKYPRDFHRLPSSVTSHLEVEESDEQLLPKSIEETLELPKKYPKKVSQKLLVSPSVTSHLEAV